MKIGLLAYHAAINFGATLQLLSTYMYLLHKGHRPVIINWIAPDLEIWYRENTPLAQLEMQERIRKQLWTESALCRTSRDVARVIEDEGIEAVIIGSDAVCQHHTLQERLAFPCRTIIGFYKVTQDRQFPNPFWAVWDKYLTSPRPICVLSASNQDSQFKYFSIELCRQMEQQVMSYAYLSVRDSWTQQMFKHITQGRLIPEVTPDPVFAFIQNAGALLPSKEDILARYGLPEKYILMSFISEKVVSASWLDTFCQLARQEGYTCVGLPFSQKETGGHFPLKIHLPLSPIDWFALLRYSRGYVGNNMHPIVVSIHCGVPFFCFDNYGLKRFNGIWTSDHSSKIKHLLQIGGLEKYRVSCLSKAFVPPSPHEVYALLRSFDLERSAAFAKQYYERYEQMMQEILACCVSHNRQSVSL